MYKCKSGSDNVETVTTRKIQRFTGSVLMADGNELINNCYGKEAVSVKQQ